MIFLFISILFYFFIIVKSDCSDFLVENECNSVSNVDNSKNPCDCEWIPLTTTTTTTLITDATTKDLTTSIIETTSTNIEK